MSRPTPHQQDSTNFSVACNPATFVHLTCSSGICSFCRSAYSVYEKTKPAMTGSKRQLELQHCGKQMPVVAGQHR